MSNYRKSSKRRKIPDPNLVEIKTKFDAEFRRFSINRNKLKKFMDFRELLLSFFKLDTPFTVCYTDPIHGDLLPINNDENYCKALSSVGANILLKVILQRQEEDLGQLTGYGNPVFGSGSGPGNKKKNRLSQYILGVPSYIMNNGSSVPGGTPSVPSHYGGYYSCSLGDPPKPMLGNGRATNGHYAKGHHHYHHPSSTTPQLPPILIGRPQDFRTVSSIIDVDLVPETQRRVRLVKPPKAQKGTVAIYDDRPLGFYIREGTSVRVTPHGLDRVPGIFVSRLVPGGIAASTGLLAVDDEVLEVNGISVDGRTLDQVTDMMIANASDLILTVKPANQANTLRHQMNRRRNVAKATLPKQNPGPPDYDPRGRGSVANLGTPDGVGLPSRRDGDDVIGAVQSPIRKNFSLDQLVPTQNNTHNPHTNDKVGNRSKDPFTSASYSTKIDPRIVASNATTYTNHTKGDKGTPASSNTLMVSSLSSYYNSGGSSSTSSTPSISQYYTTSEEGKPFLTHNHRTPKTLPSNPLSPQAPEVGRYPLPPPIPPRPSVRESKTAPGPSVKSRDQRPLSEAFVTDEYYAGVFENHQPTPPPRRRSSNTAGSVTRKPPHVPAAPSQASPPTLPLVKDTSKHVPTPKNTQRRDYLFRPQSPKFHSNILESYDKRGNCSNLDRDIVRCADPHFYYFDGADDKIETVGDGYLPEGSRKSTDICGTTTNFDHVYEHSSDFMDNNLLCNGDSAFFLPHIDQEFDSLSKSVCTDEGSEMEDDDVIVYEISTSPNDKIQSSSSAFRHSPLPGTHDPYRGRENISTVPTLLNKTIKPSPEDDFSLILNDLSLGIISQRACSYDFGSGGLELEDEYHLVPMKSHVITNSRDDRAFIATSTAHPKSSQRLNGEYDPPQLPMPLIGNSPTGRPSLKKRAAPKPPLLCSKI